MKKSLLAAAMLFGATAGWAQGSFEDALTAVVGQDNTYETTEVDSVFWKYTATQDELIYVGAASGDTYVNVEVYGTNDGTTPTLSNTMKGGQDGRKYIYPVLKDQTVYFMGYGNGTVGFNLTNKAVGGLGHGLTSDDPLTIETDTLQYLGNAYAKDYSSYNMYATYTASEDGQLVITTKAYFSSYTVNGTSYSPENAYVDGAYRYVAKTPITKGQTYNISFYGYTPLVFTATVTHPEAGSEEMPFSLNEGENTVPAAFGTYYYTYSPTHTGYMTFTSDEALAGGNVAVYQSKSYMGYGNATATSPTGSFNVRAEVKYIYSGQTYTYWVKVTKTEATDSVQKFNFSMDEYAQGETESNPLSLTVPTEEVTLPHASGNTYYSVEVPANTNKFLVVKALSGVSQNTVLYVYPKGDFYSATTSTTGQAKCDVSSTSDQTYIIRWSASETEAFKFSVSYQDIEQGSTITNPLTAVLGENTLKDDGTQYYQYTATKSGKLSVTFDNASTTATFPKGTGKWDGEYEATNSGSTYAIEATEGTIYLITVENAVKDEKFTLAEADFAEGESQNNPLYVDSTYTLSSTGYATWLAYRAPSDGKVTVTIENIEVSPYYDEVTYGKSTDNYLSILLTYSIDPTTGDYVYEFKGSTSVVAGDVVLVNLKTLTYPTDETKVVFTIGEPGEGETKAKAYLLTMNTPVTIGTPSADAPIWCKIVGNGENISIKSSGDAYGYWYTGEDKAEADAEDYDDYFSVDGLQDGGEYYIYDRTVTEANVHYLKLVRTYYWGELTLTLLAGADDTTAISDINAQADGTVKVYNLNGQKVAEQTAGLKAGIYIVSKNGQTQKVIVK